MRETIESFRLMLIKWNVAPLSVVAFLCWLTNRLVDSLMTMTCTDAGATVYGALTVLIAAMSGLLFKAYAYMQKNRGEGE